MQHGEAVKPVVIGVAADFELRRPGSHKRARKPRRQVSANGQLADAGLPIQRREAEMIFDWPICWCRQGYPPPVPRIRSSRCTPYAASDDFSVHFVRCGKTDLQSHGLVKLRRLQPAGWLYTVETKPQINARPSGGLHPRERSSRGQEETKVLRAWMVTSPTALPFR